jgi:hypothetical protein
VPEAVIHGLRTHAEHRAYAPDFYNDEAIGFASPLTRYENLDLRIDRTHNYGRAKFRAEQVAD